MSKVEVRSDWYSLNLRRTAACGETWVSSDTLTDSQSTSYKKQGQGYRATGREHVQSPILDRIGCDGTRP